MALTNNRKNNSRNVTRSWVSKVNRVLQAIIKSWPEWGLPVLLFLTCEVAVRSIERVAWINPQPSLTLVLALAIGTGWLLVRSRWPGWVIHPLAVVIGTAITVWQASNLLSQTTLVLRVNQLVVALHSWWQATSAARPSEGTIHFAVFLILTTWVMGYVSTWFVLRRQNAWVAVLLGAVAIVANLSNLPQQYYIYFFYYVLMSLLLVGLASLARSHYRLEKPEVSYPGRGVLYFTVSLLCLSLLATTTAWLTPEIRLERLETTISAKTLWRKDIEKRLSNFLASVPAKQPFLKSEEQGKLSFGDAYGKGDDVQFILIADAPYYLRTRIYDVYAPTGWTSSQTDERILSQMTFNTAGEGISQRREITYTVVPKLRTDILLTAGDFISSDIPVSVETLMPLNFNIDLTQSNGDSSLPSDVASLASSLRTEQVEGREIKPDELSQLLPEDLALTGISVAGPSGADIEDSQGPSDSAGLTGIKVVRIVPPGENIMAIAIPQLIRSDQPYVVTASISSATPAELSEAGDDYPPWVVDYYLSVPFTLSERVRSLAEKVTGEAESPYDRVMAVKRFLSRIKYDTEVSPSPPGVDGVDYFLYDQESGNCVHFASSMAVMLRSVGIPARVAVGYAPGEYNKATGSSVLRAKERHAWPEVYFPGYGWVGFEATPTIGGGLDQILAADDVFPGAGGGEEPLLEEEDGVGGVGGTSPATRNRLGLTLFLTIPGAILLAFVLWSVLSRRRQRFVMSDYAVEIYRKMCFLASLIRLSPRRQQTPLEYGARLASAFPRQVEALDNIVQTYVERQFSRQKELDIWQKGRLRKSWKMIYPAFIKRLLRIG